MSKILYLLRHAKSSREDIKLDDFDRPLNPRGIHDAHIIQQVVQKRRIMPDKIYSSPAKRAKQTVQIVREESLYFEGSQIEYIKELYKYLEQVPPKFFIKFVKGLSNVYKEVLIAWHNRMLEEGASFLLGKKIHIPAWSLLAIKFPIDNWQDIDEGSGKKLFFDTPSKFKNYKDLIDLNL